MQPTNLDVLQEPSCQHLRSKGMYVSGVMDPLNDPNPMNDGYCWCNKTQHVYGPDDQLAERQQCNSGRTCFQAVL
jgi:hypothetical protein